MFTHKLLPFSKFQHQFGLNVERDCMFSYVGKIPTRLANRIVPCSNSLHIASAVAENGIVGIVTTKELAKEVPPQFSVAVSSDPQASCFDLHEALCGIPDFHWAGFESKIHPTAKIHSSAIIDQRDVVIGRECVVGPGAIIIGRSVIGDHSKIGPGAVVGCDAFEVNLHAKPRRVLLQAGGVQIGNSVEIQAKCTIVRATFGGFTTIGDETKLDCQIHVAHDCQIGKRVRIAACAEISGRVQIGDDVFIGPNCSISNGLTIGNDATITIGSVVVRDVENNMRVTGNFALPHQKWLAFIRTIR
jgi:UDP-3-O-[3-hydroxymyristoyl] glucosamine N-acyltransferase LpxD